MTYTITVTCGSLTVTSRHDHLAHASDWLHRHVSRSVNLLTMWTDLAHGLEHVTQIGHAWIVITSSSVH